MHFASTPQRPKNGLVMNMCRRADYDIKIRAQRTVRLVAGQDGVQLEAQADLNAGRQLVRPEYFMVNAGPGMWLGR